MKTKKYIVYFALPFVLFVFLTKDVWAQIQKQNSTSGLSEITGKVYCDFNENGFFDANDFGLPNQTVVIADGKYIAVTDEKGDYRIAVKPGFYEIKTKFSKNQKITTGEQFADIKLGEGDFENNIGISLNPTIADLQINTIAINQPKPGEIAAVELIYNNEGIAQTEGSIYFIKDRNYVFVDAKPSPTAKMGDTLIWSLAVLKPFKQERIKINFELTETADLDKPLCSFVSITGNHFDSEKDNNHDTLWQATTGAIVPNSKKVDPSGIVKTYSTIPSNVSLVYTIYFQNTTGLLVNDMVIIDTLTTKLAPGTFNFLGSSHPCTIQIASNALTFEFLNINLPDSISDFFGSKGWIQFIINTSTDIFLNDSVKNVADIYFDYNVPTRTNEARIDFVNVSAIDEFVKPEFVNVFPNPFNDKIVIEFDRPCFDCNFELTDIMGKPILSREITTSTKFVLQRNTIASGFYVYKITQKNKVVEVGKLIAR